jgi:tetraacyldisaccharide 4'-kinase
MGIEDIKEFTLVTGIANSQPLVDYLKRKNLKFEHLNFKDHYEFTKQDISELNKKKLIVTTEKDYMRLKENTSLKEKLFYLPIQVTIDNSAKFDSLINNYVTIKQ